MGITDDKLIDKVINILRVSIFKTYLYPIHNKTRLTQQLFRSINTAPSD